MRFQGASFPLALSFLQLHMPGFGKWVLTELWAAPAQVFPGCTRGTAMALARRLLVQHLQCKPNAPFVEFVCQCFLLPHRSCPQPQETSLLNWLSLQQHFISFCRLMCSKITHISAPPCLECIHYVSTQTASPAVPCVSILRQRTLSMRDAGKGSGECEGRTLKDTHTPPLSMLFCCHHTPSCWALTSHMLLQPSFWMREAGPVESPEILRDAWATAEMRDGSPSPRPH